MSNESADLKPNEIAAPPRMERRENAPGAITDNTGTIAQGGQASIHDRTGLYISIIALFVSGAVFGYQIRGSDVRRLEDQAVDARIAAAVERSRGDMQAQIAAAQATANLYRTESLLTKTNVEALYSKLNVKGINVGAPNGH